MSARYGKGSSDDAMVQYQADMDAEWERMGLARPARNIREISDLLLKEERRFYKRPLPGTRAGDAMTAAINALESAIQKQKERKPHMSNELETKKDLPMKQNSITDMSNPFSSLAAFEAAQRMAMALSKSTMIPREYQENIPNCLIALEISQRLRASVLMVMQNLYIVHGKPGWSAQYIISAINSCGKFSPLRFKITETECTAFAVELKTGETLHGTKITIDMAKKEGWYDKNGSKWKTMPEQMLRYRAASFFGKIYAPEILMGFQTVEEIEDMQAFSKAKPVVSEIEPEVKEEGKLIEATIIQPQQSDEPAEWEKEMQQDERFVK